MGRPEFDVGGFVLVHIGTGERPTGNEEGIALADSGRPGHQK